MKTTPNSLMRTTRRNITAALSVTMAGLLGLTTVPAVTNTQPVAHAADITAVEDFTIDDRGVVTGLTADGKNKAIDDTNTLTIPAEVNGTQVTGIADNAFARLNLTHVDFSQVKNLDLIGKTLSETIKSPPLIGRKR